MPQPTSPRKPNGNADIIFSGGSIVPMTDEDPCPRRWLLRTG
jgi:hypothetical protein